MKEEEVVVNSGLDGKTSVVIIGVPSSLVQPLCEDVRQFFRLCGFWIGIDTRGREREGSE